MWVLRIKLRSSERAASVLATELSLWYPYISLFEMLLNSFLLGSITLHRHQQSVRLPVLHTHTVSPCYFLFEGSL